MEPEDNWLDDESAITNDHINLFHNELLSLPPTERKRAILKWLGVYPIEETLNALGRYYTTDIDDDAVAPISTADLIEKIQNPEGLYHALLEVPAAAVEPSLCDLWEANRRRARTVVTHIYPLMDLMTRPDPGPAGPYETGSNTQFWQWIEHYGYDYALMHDFFAHLDDPVLEAAWRAARARVRIFKLAQGELLTALGLV
jgi:hypothetical protein